MCPLKCTLCSLCSLLLLSEWDMFYLREERWHHSFVLKFVPVYSFEERMIFHLIKIVCAESVFRFSLNQPVHKVNTLSTPSIGRNLIKLNLLCKNFFPYFLPICTNIRSLHKSKVTLPDINS